MTEISNNQVPGQPAVGNDKDSQGTAKMGNLVGNGATSQSFVLHSMLAGLYGALSGVVGKASVSPVLRIHLAVRIACFALNAFFTAQMWRHYLKSLSVAPSTALSSVINLGTNFASSAVFGILVFGEAVTVMWGFGAALVVMGLAIIVQEKPPGD